MTKFTIFFSFISIINLVCAFNGTETTSHVDAEHQAKFFTQASNCPVNWNEFNNKCYYIGSAVPIVTWTACQTTCANLGAKMLCIDGTATNNFVNSMNTDRYIWIGYNDRASEGNFVWADISCGSSYTHWNPVEPNDYAGNEDCGQLDSTGYWNDNNCANSFACGCEYPINPTATPTAPPTVKPTANPTSQPSSQPSRQPTAQPSRLPTSQPSRQPSGQPSRQPNSRPSSHPSCQPSSSPTCQPSSAPSSVAMLRVLSSKSFKVRNGFSFAAWTSTGGVLYWAGDGTMSTQTLVSSGSVAAAVNRNAVSALTSTGTVVTAGIPAFISGIESIQAAGTSLVSIVGNEQAFAGLTAAGAVVVFGGANGGGDVAGTAFAAQLLSGVIAVIASAASFTALKGDGTVYTWGNKYCGGGVSSLTRTDLQGIEKVFATRTAFAGVTSAGKVLTWGDRSEGGDSSAVSAQLQSGVYHIVSSRSAFVAFKKAGPLVVWGDSEFGGSFPTASAELSTEVAYVAHTASAFAAIRKDRSVVTWGESQYGGDSSAVQHLLADVETVVSNLYAFAAITDTGAVVAWGEPAEGGEVPTDLISKLSTGVTEVFSTNRAFAALKGATGELVLWGNPYHGGDAGAAAQYLTSGVRTVCGNDAAFTAFLQDGRAVAWGHSSSVPQPGLLNGGAPVITGAGTAVCL